jgi:hypothetical protein
VAKKGKGKKVSTNVYFENDVYAHIKFYAGIRKSNVSASVNDILEAFFKKIGLWRDDLETYDYEKLEDLKIDFFEMIKTQLEETEKYKKIADKHIERYKDTLKDKENYDGSHS